MRFIYNCLGVLILFQLNGFCQQTMSNPHGNNLKFGCETCHDTQNWNNIPGWKFNHDQTGFALYGAHKNIQCRDCHENLEFSHIGVTCRDCHTDIHKGELGNQCENCHNSQTWENRSEIYERHNQTNFPLVGVHANVDCESCHKNEQGNQYAAISVECQSCHLNDFMKTINPSHQEANFELNCQKCHQQVTSQWQSAKFNHTETFVLHGGHKSVECIACHSAGYRGTSLECVSCHQSDYASTVDPSHTSFGFPTNCEKCHDVFNWTGAEFDHFAETNFRIEGAHTTLLCKDCHVNSQFSGTSRECQGCHLQDYNSVNDPPHSQNKFSLECLDCHTTIAWSPATFDHSTTQFPLTGAHLNANCSECHTNGYTQQLPMDCYSCHQQDFTQVTDPNHINNNFDHDCKICHTTSAWSPATFDHASTVFPLTGAHINVKCSDCHVNGYTQQLPTDCYSCHQQDFTQVTDPNHVDNNFDHDCLVCHTTNVWSPASFDHNITDFPLLGAHTSVDCNQCHSSGYQNTPLVCVACHQTDYDNTLDPNHNSAQFPTTCEDCHTAKGWKPANWDHDGQYFPIYSGSHRGKWDACTDCHVNSADYVQFECINCHEHNKTSMDDKHKERQDYEYVSIRCYDCHPNGKAD